MSDKSRRITEPVAPRGIRLEPAVGRLNAQSAQLLGLPVIVMIQPDTIAYAATSGEVLADTIEFAVREFGAQPLTLPCSFPGPPVARWRGQLDLATDELLIHFPDGTVMYDGTMPTAPAWRATAIDTETNGIVMITGPIATLSDIEPVIRGKRASWIRIPLTISQ